MNLNVNTEVSRRLEDSLRRKTLTREDKSFTIEIGSELVEDKSMFMHVPKHIIRRTKALTR